MGQEIHRGDVFWIADTQTEVGSEYAKTRPAVIVSNEANNRYSANLEIVWLTTANKKPLPTHVTLYSAPRVSVALCECVTTISKERLLEYYCTLTSEEMAHIDRAIRISLGLPEPAEKPGKTASSEKTPDDLQLSNLRSDYQLLLKKHDALLAQQAVYEKICMAFIPNWMPPSKAAENGGRV
nr:MAG TPA: PemK-like protein [Caudoviricetes sp.]